MKKHLLLVLAALLFSGNDAFAQTSLNFGGVDSYVDAGNSFFLTSYTKEAWVKWDGVTIDNNNLVSGSSTNQHAFWAPGHDENRVTSGHNGQWDFVEDNLPMPVDEWTHYAVTYDGTTGEMVLYRNGTEVDRSLDPDDDTSGFVLTEINIGGYVINDEVNPFGGLMDNVRLWDHARSPQEVSDNYQSCSDGTENGLVAYYDFEDGPGSSTLSDITGNGNDGTLINFDIDNDWEEDGITCADDPDPLEITRFHPNPTRNKVFLKLNGSYDRLQVRVYNRNGYLVRRKNVNGPADKVFTRLKQLRRGYYYVMVINRDTWEYDYVRVYKRGRH